MIHAMHIRRNNVWVYGRLIPKHQVEKKMTLVIMGPDCQSVNRKVVCDHRICYNTYTLVEIFRRMASPVILIFQTEFGYFLKDHFYNCTAECQLFHL